MNDPSSLGEPVDVGKNRYVFRRKAQTGQTYQFYCPCGETILVTFPSPGNIQFKCKNCQRLYAAMVTEAPKESVEAAPQPQPVNTPKEDNDTASTTEIGVIRSFAGAVLVYGKLLHRKKEALYYGNNVIGRSDHEKTSDIQIDDPFISRRSVDIRVRKSPDGSGNIFRLQVLQTRNPVYVNSKQVNMEEQVFLSYNDKLKLGNTILTLKKV